MYEGRNWKQMAHVKVYKFREKAFYTRPVKQPAEVLNEIVPYRQCTLPDGRHQCRI